MCTATFFILAHLLQRGTEKITMATSSCLLDLPPSDPLQSCCCSRWTCESAEQRVTIVQDTSSIIQTLQEADLVEQSKWKKFYTEIMQKFCRAACCLSMQNYWGRSLQYEAIHVVQKHPKACKTRIVIALKQFHKASTSPAESKRHSLYRWFWLLRYKGTYYIVV